MRPDGNRSRLRAVAPVVAAAVGVVTVLIVVNQVSRIARASQAVAPVAAAVQSDVPAVTTDVIEPSPVESQIVFGFSPPADIDSPDPVASSSGPAAKPSPSASARVSATPKPSTTKPAPSASASTSTAGTVTSVGPTPASVVVVNGTDGAIHVVLDGAAVTVGPRGFGAPLLVNSTGPDDLAVTSVAHPACGANQHGDFHLVAPHRYQLQIANGPGCVIGGVDVGAPTPAGFTQTDT